MPDDSLYKLARQSRKEPKNKSRIVIESPGVRDETEKKPKVTLGQGMHQVEPGDPGTGAYSDRIKIAPKFEGEPRKTPLPSDSEIQKTIRGQETQI